MSNIVASARCEQCGRNVAHSHARTCQLCKRLLCSRHFSRLSLLSADAQNRAGAERTTAHIS
jgi:hypothetical protein